MQSIPGLLRMFFLQVLRNNHNLQWSCLRRPCRSTLHPEEPAGVLVYMSDLGLSVATHHRLDASVSCCICAPPHANASSLSKVARFSQVVNVTRVRFSQVGILFCLKWVHYLFLALLPFRWKKVDTKCFLSISVFFLKEQINRLTWPAPKSSANNSISKTTDEKQIFS